MREVGGDRIEQDTDDDNQGKQQSEAKQRAAQPPGMTEMVKHAHRRLEEPYRQTVGVLGVVRAATHDRVFEA